jgi:hypothetical protein
MAPGELVTVPLPVPFFPTVSVKLGGGTTGIRSKVAVTDRA